MTRSFWQIVPEGLDISVRATPRGGADAVDGPIRDAAGATWLAVRVRAPADEGRANASVAKLLADCFDVRPRDVMLASGSTARLKRFRISGDSQKLVTIAKAFQEG